MVDEIAERKLLKKELEETYRQAEDIFILDQKLKEMNEKLDEIIEKNKLTRCKVFELKKRV